MSWLLTIADHPPTSILIKPERQDEESTFGLIRSTVINPPQNDQSFLPSCDRTPLQKQPKPKEKINPMKKKFPELIKSHNILKQRINKLNTQKQKDNTDDNPYTIDIESGSSGNKNIQDKHTNRSITQMIILPKSIISPVQVTER